jgi:hypothetical protein
MGKKLNLVLRDPVKLHDDDSIAQKLPSPFNNQKDLKENDVKKQVNPKTSQRKGSLKKKSVRKPESNLSLLNQKREGKVDDYRQDMSLRVQQIWELFCEISGEDEKIKKTFEVTRAEVMKKAGIGSTNTYRNALQKFQDLGLIEIELRPGVINGSLFHLTSKGREQVGLYKEGN